MVDEGRPPCLRGSRKIPAVCPPRALDAGQEAPRLRACAAQGWRSGLRGAHGRAQGTYTRYQRTRSGKAWTDERPWRPWWWWSWPWWPWRPWWWSWPWRPWWGRALSLGGGRRGSCPDDEASAGDMPRMARQGRAPLDGVGRRRCPITSRYVFAGLRFFITIGGPASGPLPAKHNRAL